jgi:TRAP-type C4-dicarboxylate transport system substrate-binding protein
MTLLQRARLVTRLAKWATIALLGSAMAPSTPAAVAAAPIVMKLGTGTLNDSQHEWMKIFAAIVDKDSGGRIKVEIYPASQLGTSPRMVEQTQLNSIQGVVGPPEFLTGVDARYQILSAPGLFGDLAHVNRTLQDPAFNQAFLGLGANKGLKGIGLFISGPTVFVIRKPIGKIADFAGLKLRVLAAPLQLEQVRSMQATPVPMPLGEVMPALQQGTIDGVMSCIPVLVALKYSDAAKYLVETNHGLIASLSVISKTWFDGLPADLQDIVVKAGQKASQDVYQFSVDDVNSGREKWKKAGGEVVELTSAEHDQLMRQLVSVGENVTAKNAPEKAMFDLLRTTAERTK